MHNDPHIELTGQSYEWAQGESQWHPVGRDELLDLLDGNTPPAFRTVLGKTGDLYSGPFYMDLDGDLDEMCHTLNQLLDNLRKMGVNLNAVRIFATGGRGFHIEIPQAVFGGVDHSDLPKIYKGMALEIYVDGLDLRVYSGGRGRMWRVPNVQRSNGLYKVPLRLDEARTITPERYAELCSEPRSFPELEIPALATGLAQLYTQCRDKVSASTKRVRTWTAAESELRQRFDGSVPPSVQRVLTGEFLPEHGWNEISIQLALLAHVLGWSDDRLIHEAHKLIERHESDGHRYNTPRKRGQELARMFHYVENNTDYQFSIGGLCSILPPGYKPDLQGLEADSDDEALDYAELIDACNDARAVVDLARQIKRDDSLTETETAALLKRCARAAGVGLKALRSDLYDSTSGHVITVAPSDFSGSVDSAMRVLPHIPSLRQRSGELVELRGNRICRVDVSKLAYLLSSVAKWRNGGEGGASRPDVQILNAVVGFGEWPGVPELIGVAHQPTLLPDGKLGCPSGYEPAFNPIDYPEFHGSPADAMAELRGLLREFPFATKQDEATALCAILTAVSRPAYKAAPAFFITANEAGTGKGYLCELISLFAAPETEPVPWPARREERLKTLHASLLDGRPVLYLDNLKTGSGLDDETLCTAVTEGRISARVLGSSTMLNASARVAVLANGNNIRPTGDMVRRSLVCGLQASGGTVRRKFSGNPVELVRSNRGKWVGVALKALQGVRAEAEPFASFGPWSETVLSVVIGAGLPDPVARVVEAVDCDDDRAILGHLLEAWHDRFRDEQVTLRDVWREVGHINDPLKYLLLDVAGRGDDLDMKAAGHWLAASAGRVVDGFKLARCGRGKRGAVWAVVPAA